MADALALGASAERHGGSTPLPGTTSQQTPTYTLTESTVGFFRKLVRSTLLLLFRFANPLAKRGKKQ